MLEDLILSRIFFVFWDRVTVENYLRLVLSTYTLHRPHLSEFMYGPVAAFACIEGTFSWSFSCKHRRHFHLRLQRQEEETVVLPTFRNLFDFSKYDKCLHSQGDTGDAFSWAYNGCISMRCTSQRFYFSRMLDGGGPAILYSELPFKHHRDSHGDKARKREREEIHRLMSKQTTFGEGVRFPSCNGRKFNARCVIR